MSRSVRLGVSAASEQADDPTLAIIDSHHHLWDNPGDRYAPDDLLADAGSGHRIVATVYVQAGSGHYRTQGPPALAPVGETAYAAAVAARSRRRGDATRIAAAIVGYADLLAGDAAGAVLDAHMAAGEGLFRGVRTLAAYDEGLPSPRPTPPGLLAETRYRDGVTALARRGLTLDVYLYHTQLRDLADLADAFPHTPMVLNHCGTPLLTGRYASRKPEVLAAWRRGLLAVAERPNVQLKIGALGSPRFGFGFDRAEGQAGVDALVSAWEPFVETCIETFGPARCMFESNFPPDRISCAYVTLWNAFKTIVRGASHAEKRALFHDTAAQIYRIRPDG